jgi:hyperosmotically inducible periplasmic protein
MAALLAASRPFSASGLHALSVQNLDNTSTNQPGKTPNANRADQQSQSAADRELTRKIRQTVVGDKSPSTSAHNVKVIKRDGMVALKDPVRSEEENNAVQAKAAESVGPDKVKDEITLRPKA